MRINTEVPTDCISKYEMLAIKSIYAFMFFKITIKMYNHAFNFQSIFFYDSTRLKRTQMCTRKCSAALI
jgi:hypothetical protein